MQLATIGWPLLFAIAGALLYGYSDKKPMELGRLTFFAAMLVLIYNLHGALHF